MKPKIQHSNPNCFGAEYCEWHNGVGEVFYSSKNVRKLVSKELSEIIGKDDYPSIKANKISGVISWRNELRATQRIKSKKRGWEV